MGTYRFFATRTLSVEIEVEAEDLNKAKEKAKNEVDGMANSDFSDRDDQSIELLSAPTEDESFGGQGIEIF